LHPIQIELWGDGDVGHTAASSGVMHCTICTSNLFGLYIRNEIEGAAKCVGVHVTVACCVHGSRARVFVLHLHRSFCCAAVFIAPAQSSGSVGADRHRRHGEHQIRIQAGAGWGE
jgi:hypothetical protein